MFGGVRSRADVEKEFLRPLWCKTVVLLKHGERIRAQKEWHQCWGGADTPLKGGGGKEREGFQKNFPMLRKTYKILETLPLSSGKCQVVLPSSRE